MSYCPNYRAKSLTQSLQLSARRMEMAHHNASYRETYRDADPDRNQQQLDWTQRQLVVSDSLMPGHRERVTRFCRENPDHSSTGWLMSELARLEFMLQETHRIFTHWVTNTPDTHTHRMSFLHARGLAQHERLEALNDVL